MRPPPRGRGRSGVSPGRRAARTGDVIQRSGLPAACLALALGACAHGPPGRVEKDVVFTEYPASARTDEILRRIMTPLELERARRALASRGAEVAEHPLDLSKERFTIYVPAGAPPPRGYGLLVFVAPWEQATEPRRWRPPLDRHGVIFVSASRSGNESKAFERRLPLALLAAENVRARYPVDPARVYVGGVSGGARVAQAVALAFPDVFRGVLLTVGSGPIGGRLGLRVPPAELFRRFQETRVVLATGADDAAAIEDDERTRASLRSWCVFDVQVIARPGLGHEPLDAHGLDLALEALDRRPATDAAALARCDDGLARSVSARLAAAEAALAAGDRKGARARLDDLDAEYGGLAAPASLALDARLEAP